MNIRVLIVDDTVFYRKILNDVLVSLPDVEVVGSVSNGRIALTESKRLKPDLITLDVEMPGLNGLQVLEELRKFDKTTGVIMVSSKTKEGSEATIEALALGAFDFIEKPNEDRTDKNIALLTESLSTTIKGFRQTKVIQRQLYGEKPKPRIIGGTPPATRPQATEKAKPALNRTEKSCAVAIGISTGGPNALTSMLPKLPGNINVPIFLVQHMPPVFSASLAKSLDKKCALRVKEAEDGELVQVNTVYIAEGGKQMKVARSAKGDRIIQITDDPPENSCKPAVDYLFRSIAREYGARSTCVVMTGMGSDGRLGSSVVKASGGIIIAQDEASSVVYGMPKAVVDAGLASVITPLDSIAREILNTV